MSRGVSVSTQTDPVELTFDLEEQELAHKTKRLRVLSPKECLDLKKETHFSASVCAQVQALEAEETGSVSVQSQTGEALPLIFYSYTRYLRKK